MEHIEIDESRLEAEVKAITQNANLDDVTVKDLRTRVEQVLGVTITDKNMFAGIVKRVLSEASQQEEQGDEDDDEEQDEHHHGHEGHDHHHHHDGHHQHDDQEQQHGEHMHDDADDMDDDDVDVDDEEEGEHMEDNNMDQQQHVQQQQHNNNGASSSAAPAKVVSSGGGGLKTKKYVLSPPMSQFMGLETETRPQVVKKIWEYIKEAKLQDPADKRRIHLDEALQNIFGLKMFTMFSMQKILSKHLKKDNDDTPFDLDPGDIDYETIAKPDPEKRKRKELRKGGRKIKKKRRPPGPNAKPNGFKKPIRVSENLRNFMGADMCSRGDVVKKLWLYIKERDLQNPQNKREIYCDETLRGLFDNRDTVTSFSMNKYIQPHFLKDEPAILHHQQHVQQQLQDAMVQQHHDAGGHDMVQVGNSGEVMDHQQQQYMQQQQQQQQYDPQQQQQYEQEQQQHHMQQEQQQQHMYQQEHGEQQQEQHEEGNAQNNVGHLMTNEAEQEQQLQEM